MNRHVNDKERNFPANSEGLESRASGEAPAEQSDLSGVERLNDNKQIDQGVETNPDASSSYPDRQSLAVTDKQYEEERVYCDRLGANGSRQVFVSRLQSHLGKPHTNFHDSSQFISRCREGYKNASS